MERLEAGGRRGHVPLVIVLSLFSCDDDVYYYSYEVLFYILDSCFDALHC